MVGFSASAWLRASVGLIIVGFIAVVVFAVEYPGARPESRQDVLAKAPDQHSLLIRIESTFAVEEWTVLLAGVMVPQVHSDSMTWRGRMSARPGDEILVVAKGNAADPMPHCVRVLLGGEAPRLHWGVGDLTFTIKVP